MLGLKLIRFSVIADHPFHTYKKLFGLGYGIRTMDSNQGFFTPVDSVNNISVTVRVNPKPDLTQNFPHRQVTNTGLGHSMSYVVW